MNDYNLKNMPIFGDVLNAFGKALKSTVQTDGSVTYSGRVEEQKKAVAEDIATNDLDDRDFLEDLAEYIEDETDAFNIEREDITDISVRDVDVDVSGDSADVEFEAKVYFNNFGDEDEGEWVRVIFVIEIVDLDYDDDYEDAEVDNYSFEEVLRTSFD